MKKSDFEVGDLVKHPKFGYALIVGKERTKELDLPCARIFYLSSQAVLCRLFASMGNFTIVSKME
jgi:hypothetical protein